jgi:hypothetical protein
MIREFLARAFAWLLMGMLFLVVLASLAVWGFAYLVGAAAGGFRAGRDR